MCQKSQQNTRQEACSSSQCLETTSAGRPEGWQLETEIDSKLTEVKINAQSKYKMIFYYISLVMELFLHFASSVGLCENIQKIASNLEVSDMEKKAHCRTAA